MRQKILTFALVVLWTPYGFANGLNIPSFTTDELGGAIEAWAGDHTWYECGEALQGEARKSRAQQYARYFKRVADKYKVPTIFLSSIVEQESGYDECAIGFVARQKAELPAHPTYTEVKRKLGYPWTRKRYGISYFDVGAAQFLWPRGSYKNITKGVELRDVMSMEWSVDTLGKMLVEYRAYAQDYYSRGYHFRNSRGYYKRIPPQFGYFIHHNSPDASNHQYYFNVRRKAKRILVHILRGRQRES